MKIKENKQSSEYISRKEAVKKMGNMQRLLHWVLL